MTHPFAAADARAVSHIMTTEIDTLAPSMRLAQAMSLFVERGHAAMPVVDAEGRLVGILAENDLLRVLGRGPGRLLALLRSEELRAAFTLRCEGATVGAVMTRDVTTATVDTEVSEAAIVMAGRFIACLPVVDADRRLLGIVTCHDLVRAQAGMDDRRLRGAGRDRELERLVQRELPPAGADEWLLATVRGGTAVLEGRISCEDRHLDLLRRVAAIRGIVRVADKLETAGERAW